MVRADDVADLLDGAVKVRLPGGEWSDSLTLEDIEPGTYLIETMDENGNIKTMTITITDDQIATGAWKPVGTAGEGWIWLAAALAVLLLLLLLLAHNVRIELFGGRRKIGTVRRLKRGREEMTVRLKAGRAKGGDRGRIILSKGLTKRMRGRMLAVLLGEAEVLRVRVPEDAQGSFEAEIPGFPG
ncbi:hypothetical protein SDC9_172544 [bioreactor metagenome]|uniref:Uncharacterized protein n=1 Tax=bioreactor metagenome TaxID=1076179 RepID=A0A645GE00_9ZZZZ